MYQNLKYLCWSLLAQETFIVMEMVSFHFSRTETKQDLYLSPPSQSKGQAQGALLALHGCYTPVGFARQMETRLTPPPRQYSSVEPSSRGFTKSPINSSQSLLFRVNTRSPNKMSSRLLQTDAFSFILIYLFKGAGAEVRGQTEWLWSLLPNMWAPGTELWSSGLVVSIFSQRTILPFPDGLFFPK